MADRALIDPLGRDITLSDRTWYGHIVKGHPEVAAHRDLVEGAVESPGEIRVSQADARCRLYFGGGPRPRLEICVVADVVAGVVKTAYFSRRRSGGAIEWPTSTPTP